MDYSGSRWHNFEILEGVLTPFEEFKPFSISFEFKIFIVVDWVLGSGFVYHYAVIYH